MKYIEIIGIIIWFSNQTNVPVVSEIICNWFSTIKSLLCTYSEPIT